MTHEERYICEQQKELYEYAQESGADVLRFSNAFMNSSFCNRSIDKPYSVDQYAFIVNWLEFLEWEDIRVVPEPQQELRISFEAAGWLGFVYRQLHFATGMQSRDIAAKVPVEKLIRSYGGLHTVDEDMAIDIIIEEFGVTKI